MRIFVIAGMVAILLIGTSGLGANKTDLGAFQAERLGSMKIKLTSLFVHDQEAAHKFYTEVLGFVTKENFPVGEFKWLTVVAADEPDGCELLLEPNDNEAAETFQKAIFEQGIPAASFMVDDISEQYQRLLRLGVKFTMEPTDLRTVTVAVFDDTCGNLIQIAQK